MEITNSKRHNSFVQDLREILNQTQMISYEIKNNEIKRKLSETVIPNFMNVISYIEVRDLKNVLGIRTYMDICGETSVYFLEYIRG